MDRCQICLFRIHSGIPKGTFLLLLSIFHLKFYYIVHITCLKYANSSTVFHLLFVTFLVLGTTIFFFTLPAFIQSYKSYLKNQQSLMKLVICIFIEFRIQLIFAR